MFYFKDSKVFLSIACLHNGGGVELRYEKNPLGGGYTSSDCAFCCGGASD